MCSSSLAPTQINPAKWTHESDGALSSELTSGVGPTEASHRRHDAEEDSRRALVQRFEFHSDSESQNMHLCDYSVGRARVS